MARKKRTKRPALGLQGQKALGRLELTPKRSRDLSARDVIPGLIRATTRKRVLDPIPAKRELFQKPPRQTRLHPQRAITGIALGKSKGKPLTRKTRKALQPFISEELRAAICGERKQRRQVMFAKRQTNKGAAAKSRQRTIFSDIRC